MLAASILCVIHFLIKELSEGKVLTFLKVAKLISLIWYISLGIRSEMENHLFVQDF